MGSGCIDEICGGITIAVEIEHMLNPSGAFLSWVFSSTGALEFNFAKFEAEELLATLYFLFGHSVFTYASPIIEAGRDGMTKESKYIKVK